MDQDKAKALVGKAAAAHVSDGDVLGLGTGSTVAHLLDALAVRIARDELDIVGVPTSERTAARCLELGIALTRLDDHPRLDLCIDGADEVAPGLQLIKGGGGAHFREKVVATAAARFIVIVDASKEVEHLGTGFHLPVEVVPYALAPVTRTLADAGYKPTLRRHQGQAQHTDTGNLLLDLETGPMEDPQAVARVLDATPGILEHGLFLDMADLCLVATEQGVRERTD